MPRSTRAGRRMAATLLAFLSLAPLAACGDDDDTTTATPATSAVETAAPATSEAAETTAAAESSAPAESSAASEPATTEAAPASIAMPDGGAITIGMPYDEFFAPPAEVAAKSCADQYGLEVEITPDPGSYFDYNLKLQVAAASGNAPDIAVQGLNQVTSMGISDYVLDLSSFASQYPEFSADVMPAMEAGRSNGKLVSIPWGVSAPVLFVNSDLFRAAGLDPDTNFASFDELAAAAANLTDPDKQQYGLSMVNAEGWIALQFLLGAGTNIVDANGQVTFNSDQGKAIAAKLNELHRNGSAVTTKDDDQPVNLWTQGKVGILLSTTSSIPQAVDATFDWTTLEFPPVDPSVDRQIAAGGAGISVFAKPERQEAALAVVRCLFELPTVKGVVEDLGYLPVRADADSVLEPGVLENPPLKAAFAVFGTMVPWYAFPGEDSAQAQKVFVDGWQKATQTGDDPGPTLDQAAEQVQGLIGS